MDSVVEFFLRGLVLVPVTLLPIINPLSTAPIFAATVGTNRNLATRPISVEDATQPSAATRYLRSR